MGSKPKKAFKTLNDWSLSKNKNKKNLMKQAEPLGATSPTCSSKGSWIDSCIADIYANCMWRMVVSSLFKTATVPIGGRHWDEIGNWRHDSKFPFFLKTELFITTELYKINANKAFRFSSALSLSSCITSCSTSTQSDDQCAVRDAFTSCCFHCEYEPVHVHQPCDGGVQYKLVFFCCC